MYSHPVGPVGKQRKLNVPEMSLFIAGSEIPAHVKEKTAMLGLHANFAKTKKNPLNGLSTGHGLRGMLEGKNYYAINSGFSLTALFIERSIRHEGIFDLN